MTLAQVEHAEQRMQQQWHDLVMAEQAGAPLEVLEQMYDLYILLAQEYNACSAAYQQPKEHRRKARAASRANNATGSTLPRQKNKRDTKLAS
jgi:hypothetical protein